MPAGERLARRAPGQARQPGGSRGRVAGLLDVVAGRRRCAARRRARRRGRRRSRAPSRTRRAAAPRRCGANPPTQQRGAGLRRAEHEHVAGVRVGRARLVVQVVAVVPDRDQAEVGDRGVGGGAGADDRAHRARAAPRASAGSARPGRGRRTARRGVRAEARGQRRRRAGPGRGRPGRPRSRPARPPVRPARPRPAGPASPRPAAPTRPRAPPGRADDAAGTPGRRGSARSRAAIGRAAAAAPAATSAASAARVPGRDAEAHDVDEVAGPPVGDRPEQRRRLGCQHRLGADRALDDRPACRRARCSAAPLEDVGVDQPAGEPHPHPRARPTTCVVQRRPAPGSRTAGRGAAAARRPSAGRPDRQRRGSRTFGSRVHAYQSRSDRFRTHDQQARPRIGRAGLLINGGSGTNRGRAWRAARRGRCAPR